MSLLRLKDGKFIWRKGIEFEMKKFILGLIIGLMFSFITVNADKISSPPPLEDNPIILHYLQEIYSNLHRLEVVTTNPDGSRQGKRGDALLLQTGGNNYLEINTDSSTTWRGASLIDTP